MMKIEIEKLLKMSYLEMVNYLLEKYGNAKYDYFFNATCAFKNQKVSRSSEGLYCHHIDEDKAIMLSMSKYAKKNPFSYQKAERLVYCNILEHLILHLKICLEPRHKDANEKEVHGIGGAITYICKDINNYLGGYEFKREYIITAFSILEEVEKNYLRILKWFFSTLEENLPVSFAIEKKAMSTMTDGRILDKVYQELIRMDQTEEIPA